MDAGVWRFFCLFAVAGDSRLARSRGGMTTDMGACTVDHRRQAWFPYGLPNMTNNNTVQQQQFAFQAFSFAVAEQTFSCGSNGMTCSGGGRQTMRPAWALLAGGAFFGATRNRHALHAGIMRLFLSGSAVAGLA